MLSALSPEIVTKVQGNIYLQESGSGNAVLKDLQMSVGYIDITHDGTGTFKVRAYDDKGNEKIMVNTKGKYTGRLAIPDFKLYSLEITTDGNWTVNAIYPSQFFSDKSFSGSGDFVTNSMNVSKILSQWKITHSGEGRFIVKLHIQNNTETLLDINGNYSGTVTSGLLTLGSLNKENTGYAGTLEILSSGSWKVEIIDPNDIQPSPRASGTA